MRVIRRGFNKGSAQVHGSSYPVTERPAQVLQVDIRQKRGRPNLDPLPKGGNDKGPDGRRDIPAQAGKRKIYIKYAH